ncbi:MAG TPA: TetR/AcrR family transcriptional regulator [Streptosporangiaceae bacterium]|nr:TetR/AcrR family transcriptional regulator [Streptosporangiaceae bacterium]
MATAPNGTPMRKNARANRERILAAAEAVFGASGELGSTEEVADRAGVGIATVFRHFPTKDALIEATLVRQFDRLNEQASRLAGGPDPGRAVRELIVTLIETSATKLTLISLVGESGQLPLAVQEATSQVQATISGILARAKNEGAVAEDVTVDEFFVLVRGLAQATATMPAAPVTLDRAIDIICRGLAPAR